MYIKKKQLSVLVEYEVDIISIIISSNITCSRNDMAEKWLIWC